MNSVLINISKKKDLSIFVQLAQRFGYKSKVLSQEEKEDIGLLRLMESRKNEKNLSVKEAYQILEKNINK